MDAALGFSTYTRYPLAGERTAANAERSWKAAGLAVAAPLPGDLLFTAGDSPEGHVGVYLGERNGKRWVLENTYANRGEVIGGNLYIRLTELSRFGGARTIIRFPEDVKTAGDSGEGSAAPTAPAPRPEPRERADAPFSLPLADLVNRGGALDVHDTPKVDRTDPTWLYRTLDIHADRAPGALVTNLGTVQSIVILRAPYADEMEHAMPVVGPLSVTGAEWKDTLLKTWGTIKSRYFRTESWGRYYGPIMEFSINPERYRLPIPGVTALAIEHHTEGRAWADVELHIGEHEPAEMVLATLVMAQRYKNAFIEVWLPLTYHDPQGHERTVLEPVHVGVIEEVTAAPYPHGIRFRVVPQDHALNQVGMNPADVRTHWDEAPLHQIITEIAEDHRLLIVTPSAPSLGDVPALQRVVKAYNTIGKPPLDALRELVERAGGLRFQRLAGTELASYRLPGLPRSVWAVVDPTAYHPFTAGFWKNTLWSKVYAPLAAAVLPDQNPVGEVAVIYPENLSRDPRYVKNMAAILETYGTPEARKNPLYRLLDALSAIAAASGIGSGPAVHRAYEEGDTRNALIEFINAWWTAAGSDAAPRVAKLMLPALSIEEFTARTPDASQIAAPVRGTASGVDLQDGVVRAGGAVPLRLEAQPSGTFLLSAPPGVGARASETSNLHYGTVYARPALQKGQLPGLFDVEQVPDFYPYRVTVKLSPRAGLRAGMLAVLIGTGRLDGTWVVENVAHALTGTEQVLAAVLVTQRDFLAV